jgi:PhnB protein
MKEVVTYLNFDGNCREAMTFYAKCLGGEVTLSTFAEMPGNHSPEAKDRIMHSKVIKGGTVLMASDTMPGSPFHPGGNFSIAITCESAHEIDTLFAALSEGGKVSMPLADQFRGARFGMLTDKFGIHWMLNFDHPKV